MQVNEWAWNAPEPAMSHACLMLRNGIVAIVGVRCDMGVDTESGSRHIVTSELGLKYEDSVVHEHRSDNSSFFMWQPGGSFSTGFVNTQLVLAANERIQLARGGLRREIASVTRELGRHWRPRCGLGGGRYARRGLGRRWWHGRALGKRWRLRTIGINRRHLGQRLGQQPGRIGLHRLGQVHGVLNVPAVLPGELARVVEVGHRVRCSVQRLVRPGASSHQSS